MQIIDPVYWKVWWEAIQKGYNPKDLMYSICLQYYIVLNMIKAMNF